MVIIIDNANNDNFHVSFLVVTQFSVNNPDQNANNTNKITNIHNTSYVIMLVVFLSYL